MFRDWNSSEIIVKPGSKTLYPVTGSRLEEIAGRPENAFRRDRAFLLFMGLWPAPFIDRIQETVRHLPGVS